MRSWRWYAGICAVAAVLIGIVLPLPGRGPSAASAPTPLRGADVHGGVFAIEGKQVPLPPGEWQVAGRAVSGETPHSVLSVALVRLNGALVDAAVLIQTNRLNTDAAWGQASACDRQDLYFAHTRYSSDHDGSCAYAAYVDAKVPRATTDPSWQAALLAGDRTGWHFPHEWVEAAYRISDPRDAIQVRYLFRAPDHPSPALVQSLVSWTEAGWFDVGSGFRNRLDEQGGLRDWRHPDTRDAPMLPSLDTEQSVVAHLSVKATTYRVFATLTDMSVNYIWLGSLPSAGGLAIVGATASSVLYFFHELVWSHFEHPEMAVGDLPGVGLEEPAPGA